METTSAAQTGPEPHAVAAPVSVVPARCLRCAADLSRLAVVGRYCPHCGLDTFTSPPVALREIASEIARFPARGKLGWVHLAELASAVSQDGFLPPSLSDFTAGDRSSQVVRGYANALYGLGRRYESGREPSPDRREALRCYLKSARLGNLRAFARLANRWLESDDSSVP